MFIEDLCAHRVTSHPDSSTLVANVGVHIDDLKNAEAGDPHFSENMNAVLRAMRKTKFRDAELRQVIKSQIDALAEAADSRDYARIQRVGLFLQFLVSSVTDSCVD